MRRKKPARYENEIHANLFRAIEARDRQKVLECVNRYLDDSKESLKLMPGDGPA